MLFLNEDWRVWMPIWLKSLYKQKALIFTSCHRTFTILMTHGILRLEFFVFLIKASCKEEHCNNFVVWSQIKSGKRIIFSLWQVFFYVKSFVSALKIVFCVEKRVLRRMWCTDTFLLAILIWWLLLSYWVSFGLLSNSTSNL